MASTGGLQRRRNAANINSSSHETSYTQNIDRTILGDSGVRVAVDPHDLEDDADKKHPLLTLMEEVLLLGLKDKQVMLFACESCFIFGSVYMSGCQPNFHC